MFTVYILGNSQGRKYIGHTGSIDLRLGRHNEERMFSTKNRGPWKSIRSFTLTTRGEAMRFERWLKKQKGGNSLNRILKDEHKAPE